MTIKPTEYELRNMIEKGMTLYQISRNYDTTIPVIFKLEKEYGIISQYDSLKRDYNISKEDIESMYINEGMVQERIAEEIGCSKIHVSKMLEYYHIPTRGSGKYTAQQRSLLYDEIEQRYNNGETQEQIAEKFGYTQGYVCIILKERGVPTRGRGKYTTQQRASNANEIVQRYNNGETQEQIAEKVGYSRAQVYIVLCEHGVHTRGSTGSITSQKMSSITTDKLQECIDKGMNQAQIAEHFGVSDATIFNMAEEFGIPGMVDGYRCLTPEYQAWKYTVLDKCNRTCQLCGKTGVYLEVHHIIKWADAPELRYNVDNGVPLCHECHKRVTGHEYEYAQYFLDIMQPQCREHEIIESMPWEPPLELHSIIDYSEEKGVITQ